MRVAVYGIGNNFIRNYQWITERYEICMLVDGGKSKQGSFFQGFLVQPPETLKEAVYDAILITPNSHGDIVTFLLAQGIKPERMIFLNDILPSDDVGRELSIAFLIVGGLGDALIALNYIAAFHRKFEAEHIRFYLETLSGRNGYKTLISKENIFAGIDDVSGDDICPEKYHLYIRIQRYPEVIYTDKVRIARLCPELIDYLLLLEKFRIFYPRYFERDFVADGISAAYEAVCGRKRYEQPDVYGYLGVSAHFDFTPLTDCGALKRHGLAPDAYITVHRGTEERNYAETATKLWTVDGYNAIFRYINECCPELPVVMVGADYERNKSLIFHGIDLVGKTTLPELAMVVGNARVHIDMEGGLVHLRHAVSGKPSVVLFGPTSEEFFGYEENENIRSTVCPYPCEWMTEDWNKTCIREDESRGCMERLKPETVQDAIKRVLER